MNHATTSMTRVGVHVLTEFVYCRRAGIVAHRQGEKDSGDEEHLPRLDRSDDFDAMALTDSLVQLKSRLRGTGTLLALAFAAVTFVLLFIDWILGVILSLALLPLCWWYFRQCWLAMTISRCLRTAHASIADEPALPLHAPLQVNWWSLLRAGFVALEYDDHHVDDTIGLAGRPWRVLQKGSLRIPVFRKRYGGTELHPQHHIRIAAYCHLMEHAEMADSPYGVVLFGDGYDGVAIPVLDQWRQQLDSALKEAQHLISEYSLRDQHPPTPPESVCHTCPWGQPVQPPVEELSGVLMKPSEDVKILRSRVTQRWYYSPCSATFKWVAPHHRAKRLRLTLP